METLNDQLLDVLYGVSPQAADRAFTYIDQSQAAYQQAQSLLYHYIATTTSDRPMTPELRGHVAYGVNQIQMAKIGELARQLTRGGRGGSEALPDGVEAILASDEGKFGSILKTLANARNATMDPYKKNAPPDPKDVASLLRTERDYIIRKFSEVGAVYSDLPITATAGQLDLANPRPNMDSKAIGQAAKFDEFAAMISSFRPLTAAEVEPKHFRQAVHYHDVHGGGYLKEATQILSGRNVHKRTIADNVVAKALGVEDMIGIRDYSAHTGLVEQVPAWAESAQRTDDEIQAFFRSNDAMPVARVAAIKDALPMPPRLRVFRTMKQQLDGPDVIERASDKIERMFSGKPAISRAEMDKLADAVTLALDGEFVPEMLADMSQDSRDRLARLSQGKDIPGFSERIALSISAESRNMQSTRLGRIGKKIVGILPIVGSAADGADAAIAASEGRNEQAAVSAVATVPVVGDVAAEGAMALNDAVKLYGYVAGENDVAADIDEGIIAEMVLLVADAADGAVELSGRDLIDNGPVRTLSDRLEGSRVAPEVRVYHAVYQGLPREGAGAPAQMQNLIGLRNALDAARVGLNHIPRAHDASQRWGEAEDHYRLAYDAFIQTPLGAAFAKSLLLKRPISEERMAELAALQSAGEARTPEELQQEPRAAAPASRNPHSAIMGR